MAATKVAAALLVVLATLGGHASFSAAEATGLTDEVRQWIGGIAADAAMSAKLAVHEFAAMGHGFVATSDIAPNETLVDLPIQMLMSQQTAVESAIGDVIVQLGDRNYATALALHLLYEKSTPGSKYTPYVRSLPATLDLPLVWTDAELAELRGTRLLDYTLQQREAVRTEYDNVVKPLVEGDPARFPPAAFSLQEFTWAVGTVLSRSFVFTLDGSAVPFMVPVGDLFNHDNVRTETVADVNNGRFTIRMMQEVPAGQQVFVNLGAKSNFALMANMGFALPHNAFDSVSFVVKVDAKDPFQPLRTHMLEVLGTPAEGRFDIRKGDSLVPLMQALRVQVMKPSEFDKFELVQQGKAVSLENELEAMRVIIAACKAGLELFPTSLADDTALLMREGGLARRHAFAVLYRRSEKLLYAEISQAVIDAWRDILLKGLS